MASFTTRLGFVAEIFIGYEDFWPSYMGISKEDFAVITTPEELSFTKEFDYEIAKIKLGRSTMTTQDVALKYYWILSSYNAVDLVDNKYVSDHVKELTVENAEKIINETDNYLPSVINNKNEIYNKLNISADQKRLLSAIASFIVLQDKRKEVILRTNSIFLKAANKLLDMYKVNNKDRKMILSSGYPLWFSDFSKEKLVLMCKEAFKCFYFPYQGEIKVGDEALKEYEQESKESEILDVAEIKGRVAYPGIIKGKVIKIFKNEDFHKFEDGAILVTSMTRPEFVPLMKKAIAVITDEGGVTCHAAIVSRELKIPCIIGTKIATQILKDGDLVEVDADKGIVRILNSENKNDSEVSEKVKEILKTKWYHLGKWIEPALAAELWLEYGQVAQQFFREKLDNKILYLNGDFFLSQHDSDIFIKEGYEAAKNHDKKFFEKIYKSVNKVSAGLVKKIRKNKPMSEFLAAYKNLTGIWMPLNNVAIGIEKYVQEINPEAFNISRGYLKEKPWTFQQLDEMNKLKIKIEKKLGKKLESMDQIPVKFKKAIEKHLKKYEWVGTHHFNISQLTLEGLFEKMQQEKAKSQIVNKKLDKESQYLVWLLDMIGFVRFKAAETSGLTTYYLKERLDKIAQDHTIDYNGIVEHIVEEITRGKINQKIVAARKENTGFYFDGIEYLLSIGQTKKCEEELLKVAVVEDVEIKGLTAQMGKATGRVKIVTRQDQMQGFEEGMILVSYETTPDIIFAMQKSAAIITDFGGLTSHAAIVARELKKPCIVGTKNATKVLRDGDLVEVDADKGIVKIIK